MSKHIYFLGRVTPGSFASSGACGLGCCSSANWGSLEETAVEIHENTRIMPFIYLRMVESWDVCHERVFFFFRHCPPRARVRKNTWELQWRCLSDHAIVGMAWKISLCYLSDLGFLTRKKKLWKYMRRQEGCKGFVLGAVICEQDVIRLTYLAFQKKKIAAAARP